MNYMDKVSERIVELREERGETQQELADAIGITRQSLSRYEIAARTINVDVLGELANHFGVSADYLLGLSDVKSTEQDMKIACEVTGLSEKAIENLSKQLKRKTIDFYTSENVRAFMASAGVTLSKSELEERGRFLLQENKRIISDFFESEESRDFLDCLIGMENQIDNLEEKSVAFKEELKEAKKDYFGYPVIVSDDYDFLRIELLDAYEALSRYADNVIKNRGIVLDKEGVFFHGKHNQTEE